MSPTTECFEQRSLCGGGGLSSRRGSGCFPLTLLEVSAYSARGALSRIGRATFFDGSFS